MSDVMGAVVAGDVVHLASAATPLYRTHPQLVAVPVLDAEPLRSAVVTRRWCGAVARSFSEAAATVISAQEIRSRVLAVDDQR